MNTIRHRKHRNSHMGNVLTLAMLMIFLCAFLLSCTNGGKAPGDEDHSAPNPATSIVKPIQVDAVSMDIPAHEMLLDDSYIYLSLLGPEDGSVFSYYRLYFTGEKVNIAQVPDFYLSMKPAVIIGDSLYKFVTLVDETDQTELHLVNAILQIKLDGTELARFPIDDSSLPAVMPYAFSGKIVAFKSIRQGAEVTTWIQSFDLETHEWENFHEEKYDMSRYSGTAIYGLCSNGEKLYALFDERNGFLRVKTYLKVFDSSFNETASIELDRDVANYISSSSRIADMQAFGDYVFIDNASNLAVLGRIVNGKFEEVFRGEFFEIAPKATRGSQLFYTARSNTFYTLDQRTALLTPHTLQLGGDYTIRYMMATDSLAFVLCKAEDQPDYAYVLPLDQLEGAYLPCSEEPVEP